MRRPERAGGYGVPVGHHPGQHGQRVGVLGDDIAAVLGEHVQMALRVVEMCVDGSAQGGRAFVVAALLVTVGAEPGAAFAVGQSYLGGAMRVLHQQKGTPATLRP